MGIDVALEVLGIDVHCSEFIYSDDFSVFADSFEADEDAGVGFDCEGTADFSGGDVELAVSYVVFGYFKSGHRDSSEDFNAGELAVTPSGDEEVYVF